MHVFFMEDSIVQDSSNIDDLISTVAIPGINKYQGGISMSLESNQFLRNKEMSSIIYSEGTDLEDYKVFIDSSNNIYK